VQLHQALDRNNFEFDVVRFHRPQVGDLLALVRPKYPHATLTHWPDGGTVYEEFCH
jgi:hypothetical protein